MRISIKDLQKMKKAGLKIPMLTAYDYTTAQILEKSKIPIILVGDSLGQVILGYESTIPVTLNEMIYHAKTVVRATKTTHIVVDLPFLSYQTNNSDAIKNAGKILKETGAQSVKLEGGKEITSTINYLINRGIPIMGHIGLTPQSVHQQGGYGIQGKTAKNAQKIIDDASYLEDSGAYGIVLESIPSQIAKIITDKLSIPTIGIGSGVYCDGQVQVFHDLVGLFDDFKPKHAKRYLELSKLIQESTMNYIDEVNKSEFPSNKESFFITDEELKQIKH